MVPQTTKFQRGTALLALLLAGCAAEWEERSGSDRYRGRPDDDPWI